ncbi:MAG: tetratricopeptide repeat protein [Bacteroidota bacterium]
MRFLVLLLAIASLACTNLAHGQTIDSLKTVLETTPKNTNAQVDVLNTIGFEYWIIDPDQSIAFGEDALALAQRLEYPQGIAQAYRVVGVAHWTQGNLVDAIKALDKAERQFRELNDEEGVANTLLNSGMVYADLQQNDKALSYYEKAIDKFTVLNMDSRIATTLTKIATLYIEQDNLFDAKEYLDNALAIHSKNEFTYGLSEVHNRLGILFIKQKNTEQAYYHIRQSIVLGRDINDKDGMVSNLIQYGKLLRMDGNLPAADMHFKLALNRARENSLKRYQLQTFKELSELKKVEGQLDSSLQYFEKYTRLKDSIFTSEKSAQIAAIGFAHEMEAKDKELAILQERKRADVIVKWGLFGGVILITITGLIVISSMRQRNRRNKELSLQRQELLSSKEALARTALENSKLRQQELEQKLDYKNKELTSYTLNFVQKNEFLQQLREKVQLAKAATTKEKEALIQQLDRDIRQYVTIDKDWEDFKRYFENVHTDFYKNLKDKHPDLSPNDLKICALTRLNLNIKETAGVLGISPESAKTARYRLRKKLNLEAEQNLLDYFLALEQA